MSGLHSFFRFLVYSNLFIGLCAAALAAETFLLYGLPRSLDWYIPLLFYCTLFVYSLHYASKLRKGKSGSRMQWCRQHPAILPATIIVSAAGIAGLVIIHRNELFFSNGTLRYSNIAWFILIPLLALAYSHPLNPVSKKSLRQVGWLKMVLLSGTWSFTTTALPILMLVPAGTVPAGPLAALCLHRFFLAASLSILFNILDYDEDRADGIKTIAVSLGPVRTLQSGKWVTGLLNAASAFWLIRAFDLWHPVFYLALGLPVLLVFAAYQRFRREGEEVFFVLRHDGLMIVQALLLIFALLTHPDK